MSVVRYAKLRCERLVKWDPAASDAVRDLIQRLADDEEYIQRCAVNSPGANWTGGDSRRRRCAGENSNAHDSFGCCQNVGRYGRGCPRIVAETHRAKR